MTKLCILCFLFFLAACDFSSTARNAARQSEEILSSQDLDAPSIKEGESTAIDVLKEDIQFPIWWVQKDFEQGNSPKVVVFFTDGRIYARQQQNQRLKPIGIWAYDPTYQRIFTSLGAQAELKVGTQSDGRWDGRIYFQQTELLRGSPDFTMGNIAGKYASNLESTENIYQNFSYIRNRAKVMTVYSIDFLADGTFKFAGIIEAEHKDLQSLWAAWAQNIFKWRIAPLGDAIEIYDLPEPYQGLMLDAQYETSHHGHAIVIRALAHTHMPVYKNTHISSAGGQLEMVENSGGQAFMTLIK